MVEKFTGYKASNGKSFDDEREAWGEELSILITALADNDAIARKVVAGIMTNPHDIADVLVKLADMTETVAQSAPRRDYTPPPLQADKCPHATPVGTVCLECCSLVVANGDAHQAPVIDPRPANCRFRLQDEGQSFPKSGCTACGVSVGNGLGNSCSRMMPS